MPGNDAASKFFEALNETSDAVIDAIRAANDRGHRVSTALIEQAQENQREAVDLAKKWIAAPLDIPGFYSSVVETATKAQGRALDATRLWFGELAEAQKEGREILQRMLHANRTAGEATVDAARGILSRASDNLQANASNGDGRKAPAPVQAPQRATEITPAD